VIYAYVLNFFFPGNCGSEITGMWKSANTADVGIDLTEEQLLWLHLTCLLVLSIWDDKEVRGRGRWGGRGKKKRESGDCTSLLRFVTDRYALDTPSLNFQKWGIIPKAEGTLDLPVPLGSIELSKKKKKRRKRMKILIFPQCWLLIQYFMKTGVWMMWK